MDLKVGSEDVNAGGDTNLTLASNNVTADGMLYERGGIKYIVVAEVTITNLTHEDFGPIPSFAVPEPKP
jgi:hypothetical protein